MREIESYTQISIHAFQCQHLYGTLLASILRSGADFAVFWCYLGQICIKFGANLAPKILEFMQKKALSNCAI